MLPKLRLGAGTCQRTVDLVVWLCSGQRSAAAGHGYKVRMNVDVVDCPDFRKTSTVEVGLLARILLLWDLRQDVHLTNSEQQASANWEHRVKKRGSLVNLEGFSIMAVALRPRISRWAMHQAPSSW